MGGSAGFLSAGQEDDLKAWVGASLPRTTRQVGAWIEQHFGLVYESRSGLIALLHRLGLDYHKPNVIPRELDEEKQKAFIASYEKLLNSLADNEAVLFADAVHPTHAARPVGCWAPKQDKLAIEQTSGRQGINIHGALDLATGQTRMIEAATVDAASTIKLLEAIEALYPMLALIHVFLDNARYHHAKLVQDWLSRPDNEHAIHRSSGMAKLSGRTFGSSLALRARRPGDAILDLASQAADRNARGGRACAGGADHTVDPEKVFSGGAGLSEPVPARSRHQGCGSGKHRCGRADQQRGAPDPLRRDSGRGREAARAGPRSLGELLDVFGPIKNWIKAWLFPEAYNDSFFDRSVAMLRNKVTIR